MEPLSNDIERVRMHGTGHKPRKAVTVNAITPNHEQKRASQLALQGKGVPSTQGLDTKKFCVEHLSFRLKGDLRNTILTCVRVVPL